MWCDVLCYRAGAARESWVEWSGVGGDEEGKAVELLLLLPLGMHGCSTLLI